MLQQRPGRLAAASSDRRRGTEPASQPSTVPATAANSDSTNTTNPLCQRATPAALSRASRSLRVRPLPRRHEHREGEQQRHRLAAEQQQPAAGDPARVGRGAELVGRRGQLEAEARAWKAVRACSIRVASASPTRSETSPRRAAGPSHSCGRRRAGAASGRARRRRSPARAAAGRPVVAADLLGRRRTGQVLRRDGVAEERRPYAGRLRRPATSRRPGTFVIGPPRRITSTSQCCGRQTRGRRPERRCTQRPRSSTAPRLSSAPPNWCSR